MDELVNILPASWSSESSDTSLEASSYVETPESSVEYEYDGDDGDADACAHAGGFDDDDQAVLADPMMDAAFKDAMARDSTDENDFDVTLSHGVPAGTIECDEARCRHNIVGKCNICITDAQVMLQTELHNHANGQYIYTCSRGHVTWFGMTGRDCIACAHEGVYAASGINIRASCPREGDPVRVECGNCGIVQYQHAWTDDECRELSLQHLTYDCSDAHRLPTDCLDIRAYVRSICEFLYGARFDSMCPIQNTAYSQQLGIIVTCSDDEASMSQRPIHYARTHNLQHVHVQYAPKRTELIVNIVSAFNQLGGDFVKPAHDVVIADYNMCAGICDHVEPFADDDLPPVHTTLRVRLPPKQLRRCKEFNIRGEIAHLRKDVSMSLPKFTKRDVAAALGSAITTSTLTQPRKNKSQTLLKM